MYVYVSYKKLHNFLRVTPFASPAGESYPPEQECLMTAANHPPCQSALASPVVPGIGSCEHVGGAQSIVLPSPPRTLLLSRGLIPAAASRRHHPNASTRRSHIDQMMQRGEHPLRLGAPSLAHSTDEVVLRQFVVSLSHLYLPSIHSSIRHTRRRLPLSGSSALNRSPPSRFALFPIRQPSVLCSDKTSNRTS